METSVLKKKTENHRPIGDWLKMTFDRNSVPVRWNETEMFWGKKKKLAKLKESNGGRQEKVLEGNLEGDEVAQGREEEQHGAELVAADAAPRPAVEALGLVERQVQRVAQHDRQHLRQIDGNRIRFDLQSSSQTSLSPSLSINGTKLQVQKRATVDFDSFHRIRLIERFSDVVSMGKFGVADSFIPSFFPRPLLRYFAPVRFTGDDLGPGTMEHWKTDGTIFWCCSGMMPSMSRSSLCSSRSSAVNSVKNDWISCSSTASSLPLGPQKKKPKKNKQTNKQRKNRTRESGSVQIDQLRSYRPSVGATADWLRSCLDPPTFGREIFRRRSS